MRILAELVNNVFKQEQVGTYARHKKNGGRSHRSKYETKPLGDSIVSFATLT
jgi:hypothetical protein